jgi:hypothetical protein
VPLETCSSCASVRTSGAVCSASCFNIVISCLGSSTIAALAASVVVVVFARLGREGVSIISMRAASKDERKQYAERQEKGWL